MNLDQLLFGAQASPMPLEFIDAESGNGRSLADHRHTLIGIPGEASDRSRFHLPGQHDQQSHAGEDARNEAAGSGLKTAADGKLPETVVQAFVELGDAQRGKPERAMTAYQHEFAGVMNTALEHTGDLTHRMTHMLKWGDKEDGREYVLDKTEKVLRWLTKPYGFDREHEENLAVVAKTRFGGDAAKAQARAAELMNAYADRHAELPVYNRAQWLGREAAIQLGRGNTWGAVDALRELNGMAQDAVVWNRNATAYRMGPDEAPLPYTSDRKPKSFARDRFHLPGQHEQADHGVRGKWKEEDGKVVAYHGTVKHLLPGIKKNGLRIKGAPRTFGDGELYEGLRGQAVFVASRWQTAAWYARQHAARYTPVVLELRVPKGEFKRFMDDKEHAGVGAAYTDKNIPAKWIVKASRYDRWDGLQELDFAELETTFIVLLLDEASDDDRAEFHLPGQHEQQSHAGDDGGVAGDKARVAISEDDWHSWAYDSELFNEALRGTLLPGAIDGTGNHVTANDVADINAAARRIQAAAESNVVVGVPSLWRGVSFENETEARSYYKRNRAIEADGLVSTTTERDAALDYAHSNMPAGDSGRFPVLLRYGSSDAKHVGIQTSPLGVPSNEVVLPKGSVYRVASTDVVDGVMVVNLYRSGKVPRGLPEHDARPPRVEFHLSGQHDQQSHAGGDAPSSEVTTGKALKAEASTLARVAQKVYDEWDENEDEYAGGGICHLIADELAGHLQTQGVEANTVSAQIGDQHVWVVAQLPDGVYTIDIPPSTYETGGGYSWKKVQGVTLTADDVVVERIDANPAKYEEYLDFTSLHFHLPGQHDQADHGHRGGAREESAAPSSGRINLAELNNTAHTPDAVRQLESAFYNAEPETMDEMFGWGHLQELQRNQRAFEEAHPGLMGVRADAELTGEAATRDTLDAAIDGERTISEGLQTSAWIAMHGRGMTVPDAPPAVPLGRFKRCYDNTLEFVARNRGHKYCEGLVVDAKTKMAFQHAWAVDKQGRVVDVTLGWQPKAYYHGVTYPNTRLVKAARAQSDNLPTLTNSSLGWVRKELKL